MSTKKVKLCHVQLLPILSGVQNMMLSLLKELDKDQYEIYVISKPNGELVQAVQNEGYYHISISSLRRDISLWDILTIFKLFLIFRKYRFDVVHTHSSKTGFLGRISARIAGIPKIIHTSHGFPFHQFQPHFMQRFYKFLEKFAALFCDYVVFVNQADYDFAIQTQIVPESKAKTIYNGVLLPDVRKDWKNVDWNNQIMIGSIARFSAQKNSINTVKASIKAVQKDNRLNFTFIGDGELLDECKKLVHDAGMHYKISFPGWKNKIFWELLRFDIFLLYSKWEGLPISILEAMSVGLPVIASNIKGNDELVTKETGVLIPVLEVDKLTNFFLSLPNEYKEWQKKGNLARKMVEEKFNMKQFTLKYKDLYDS